MAAAMTARIGQRCKGLAHRPSALLALGLRHPLTKPRCCSNVARQGSVAGAYMVILKLCIAAFFVLMLPTGMPLVIGALTFLAVLLAATTAASLA